MSLNLYSLIIKAANDNNINITLEDIGRINNTINNLISRKTNIQWIKIILKFYYKNYFKERLLWVKDQ